MIIAHRGASGIAPESTRAAIREAIRARADMIELDVQLSRDLCLIVFHDDRLERTTNGSGRVAHTPSRQLLRLDAGSWFHPRFRHERILLLPQALHLIPKHVGINLELKPTAHRRRVTMECLRLAHRLRLGRRLLVSSVDPRLLRACRSAGIACALICRRAPARGLQQAARLGCEAWHPFHRLVTRQRLARAHALGLRVRAWTVDQPRRLRQLADWGVDGVFTNNPAQVRRLLR